MKRYAAFDPPEYINWTGDAALVREYVETLERDSARAAVVNALNRADLLGLYAGLVRNRLFDISLKRWVRQGILTKAWLGTGEEAVTIGSVRALEQGDIVTPMIRNAAACFEMGMSMADCFRGYLATRDSPTQGRDLHVGDLRHGVIAPISHVGAALPVAVGSALGLKLRGESHVAMTWVGDGSTKTGDFHEGCNFAAVSQAPIVIIIQNNRIALGTRLERNHRGRFEGFASAYGMSGGTFAGNNVLDAFAACKHAVDAARSGSGPALLIADTFRMGGHATHDEREARSCLPPELFEFWGKRDPIGLYEEFLISEWGIARVELKDVEAKTLLDVETSAAEALESKSKFPIVPERVAEGLYAG